MLQRTNLLICIIGFFAFAACEREESFPDIGDKITSPTDVGVSDDGSVFYVLSSDFDRTFNKGSLMALNADGEKLKTIQIPRLGRAMTVAGNNLLLVTDNSREDGDPGAQLILFNLDDPKAPAEQKRWTLGECLGDRSPLNVVAAKNYAYFAVTCAGGTLYLGKFQGKDSDLTHVRSYSGTRRAMFLDTKRHLILSFFTDLRNESRVYRDRAFEDVKTYADDTLDTTGVEGSNDIPDEWEASPSVRSNQGRWRIYQYTVYNIAREVAPAGTTHVAGELPQNARKPDFKPHSDAVVQREYRFLYYNIYNYDFSPDSDVGLGESKKKYFRTNFWEAKSDALDRDIFYLSQRGPMDGANGNRILRVRIVGDVADPAYTYQEKASPVTRTLFNKDVLSFDQIYGFNQETSSMHYASDFEFTRSGGQEILLVNHFRDFVSFESRSNVHFGIVAQAVGRDANTWYLELSGSNDPQNSYFQIAANQKGRFVTGSFYGNSVLLLDVAPDKGITVVKRIN